MLRKTDTRSDALTTRDLEATEGFLLDWDGCCAIDNCLVPEAAEFLREHQAQSAIVSNNSTNTVEDFRSLLAAEGIEMRADQIVLAGVEALGRAAELNASRTLVLGDPHMRAIARSLGVTLVQEDATLVVLLRDTRFSYRRLERAVNALKRGATLIVANPDKTHPGTNGRLMPESGALLAAIQACVNIPPRAIEIIGKPSPRLFQKGCAALGLPAEKVMMIGDNPHTDMRGADALGMRKGLVTPSPGIFFRGLQGKLRNA